MATINTINNRTYQVVLSVNGINTTVNVFANNENEAIANARYQVNPERNKNIGVVKVNSFNACSAWGSARDGEGNVTTVRSTRSNIWTDY